MLSNLHPSSAFITPTLAESTIKAGHYQFHQHFINDHNGVYIQFKAGDLSDTPTMYRSHDLYIRLCMGRRDIVERYIEQLEVIYI